MKFKIGDKVKVVADPREFTGAMQEYRDAILTIISVLDDKMPWYLVEKEDGWHSTWNGKWLQHIYLEDKKSIKKSELNIEELN